MGESPNFEPFKEPLKKTSEGFMSRHMELPNSGKHVRAFNREKFGNLDPEKYTGIFNAAREHFTRLQEKYGLHVPHIDYVIGHGKTKDSTEFYTLTDEIEGRTMQKMPQYVPEFHGDYSTEIQRELGEFFSGVFQYLSDCYAAHDSFLKDLYTGQLVYGHKQGESEMHLYMIDVDPWLEFSGSETYDAEFDRALGRLEKELDAAQIYFDTKMFANARQQLEQLKAVVAQGRGR